MVVKRWLVALACLLAVSAYAQNPPAATSGPLSTTGSIPLTVSGYGSVAFQLSGTWSGTAQFEGSALADCSTYGSLLVTGAGSGSTATSTTGNGIWIVSVGGLHCVRVRTSALGSGTLNVSIQAAASGGGGGGGGGGAAGSVTINDPNTTTQKAAVNASGQLSITCANCSGTGASAVDSAAYTVGSDSLAPAGGLFDDTPPTDLSAGHIGTFRLTPKRALHVDLRNQVGTEVGTSGAPLQVSLANTAANSTAVKVDNSAVTQPVSASALPLPTGASTAAKQPALGTAGSAASDVLSVQGIASGTALGISAASLPLPTGAATAAKQPALGTAGSPSTDVISIQGVASGTVIPISAASLPLPSAAATSTKQSDGSQKTQIVDGSGNVIASTSNNLNVQCANCSGSGASATDAASFTETTSTFAPVGGYYKSAIGALTTGQQGTAALTAYRAFHVTLYDSSNNEILASPSFTVGSTAPTSGSMFGGYANSAAPTAVTAGQGQYGWFDLSGRLHVTGDASMTALKVDGSAVTQPTSAAAAAFADGSIVVLGAKADAKSTATDTTAITFMQVLKQISASVQAPPSQAVTNGGTFATQSAVTAASGAFASGALASGAAASGAFASDSASFGVGATAAAVPAKANYIGGIGSGNLTGYFACDNSVVYDAATNGKTQLVALSSGKTIYVCGISLTQATSTTVTVSLGSGTGSNCASTYTAKTPAWPLQAPASVAPTGQVLPMAMMPWFQTAASEELCISTNAGVSVQALVRYTQF